MQSKNARFGLKLFFAYLVLYGGFVLVSALVPTAMEWQPVAELNLALLWGFGLIFAAIVLALVYGVFCQQDDEDSGESQ